MIDVKGLMRRNAGRTVLDGVTFRVAPGEVVGFLGPNGAGKTTTLRVLAGILAPHGGRVAVAGRFDPLDDPDVRARIGYLPEHIPVVGDVSAVDYVAFSARMRGAEAPDREARRRLDEVDLSQVVDRPVCRLSKGQRQRVGLAAALAGDPEVLLLDEPTTGLDPGQLVRIRALIRNRRGRCAVLLSTHILPEVAGTCDRVIVLHRGRIVAERNGVLSSTSFEIRVRGNSAELVDRLRRIPGVLAIRVQSEDGGARYTVDADRDVRAALAESVVAVECGLLELRRCETDLEEMFLELVAGEGARE